MAQKIPPSLNFLGFPFSLYVRKSDFLIASDENRIRRGIYNSPSQPLNCLRRKSRGKHVRNCGSSSLGRKSKNVKTRVRFSYRAFKIRTRRVRFTSKYNCFEARKISNFLGTQKPKVFSIAKNFIRNFLASYRA